MTLRTSAGELDDMAIQDGWYGSGAGWVALVSWEGGKRLSVHACVQLGALDSMLAHLVGDLVQLSRLVSLCSSAGWFLCPFDSMPEWAVFFLHIVQLIISTCVDVVSVYTTHACTGIVILRG